MKQSWYVGYCKHNVMIMASEDEPEPDFMRGVYTTGFAPLTAIRQQLNRCKECSRNGSYPNKEGKANEL